MMFDQIEALQVSNAQCCYDTAGHELRQSRSWIGKLSTGGIVSKHPYDFLHGMDAETKTAPDRSELYTNLC